MICHLSQRGLLCTTRPKQQQRCKVCRRSAKRPAKQLHSYHPPTRLRRQLHTHTQKYTKATQKRDDCSQCATGLAVLFENLGALGLILAPRHPLCLPQPASLQGCPCVALLLFHTHTHTQSTLSPYQKRKASLFAQTVSCSNFRCEQLVLGLRGGFSQC